MNGFPERLSTTLVPILEAAISRKVTPGAVVLVSERGNLYCEAFGASAEAQDGGVRVENDTIYDAASLTKAAVTSCLLMTYVAEGTIALSDFAAQFVPELNGPGKDRITIAHLLGHASGLPAHVHFFDDIRMGELAGTDDIRDALVVMAGRPELAYETGSKTIYSDLGYILLARIVERIGGQRIDRLFQERIAEPLGMTNSYFVDLQEPNGNARPQSPQRVAPTKQLETGKILRAEVHDDNAHSGGGISGHAGLFSTAPDLGQLLQSLNNAYLGSGDSIFTRSVVREFWSTPGTASSASRLTTWRMGWDTPSGEPGSSHSGDRWPASGVGHLGFTGTAMWLAPEHDRFVVILTNRVYYSRDPKGIKSLRRALMEAITIALPSIA